MVIWLIGLSGAGKTTIAREVYGQWKSTSSNTVLIDGDEIREIFKHNKSDTAYTIGGRRENAERIVGLCRWLDRQDINVVCSILCIFEDILESNQKNYSSYFEVFVSVPLDILKQRDVNNLYKPAIEGEKQNVVGVDIPFPTPRSPDIIIDNSNDDVDHKMIASNILRKAINR